MYIREVVYILMDDNDKVDGVRREDREFKLSVYRVKAILNENARGKWVV